MKSEMRRIVAGLSAMAIVASVTAGADVDAKAKAKLSKKKVTLEVGKTFKLKAKGVKKVKWSTSNKKVVKLSKKKKKAVVLKAKKVGKATIKAKATLKNQTVKKLTCKVTVVAKGQDADITASAGASSDASAAPSASAGATAAVGSADPNGSANPGATDTVNSAAPAASSDVNEASAAPSEEASVETSEEASAQPSEEPTEEPTVEPTEKPIPPTVTIPAVPNKEASEDTVPYIVDVEDQISLADSYRGEIPYIGTCANYYGYGNKKDQLTNETSLAFIKKHFNSFTLENEMKPDAILGSRIQTISIAEAKELGYVIPEDYPEEVVPKLNFGTVDATIQQAYEQDLKMRAHTLMWHQQTTAAFFSTNYSSSEATTPEIMDKRLEFYVKTVMSHVMEKEIEVSGEAGSVVYAWDVCNEYLHHDNSPTQLSWASVYGELGLEPTYVKKAFEFAYEALKEYEVEDQVTLFNNDYDTYFEIEDMVQLVNYINEGEEANICGGIGMQSHVDIDRPQLLSDGDDVLDAYEEALDAFLATGLEVQITEFDATINFDHEKNFSFKNEGQTGLDQAEYVYEFMKLILSKQRNRDTSVSPKGITGFTLWGLTDTVSWRNKMEPLLFSEGFDEPKYSYYAFLAALTADE